MKNYEIKKTEYSKKKLFVFDMIGTLTDERRLVAVTFSKLLPQYSYKFIKQYYEKYKVGEISREEFWNKFQVDNIEEMENLFLDLIHIREGMFDLLREMKKHFHLAILSNIPKELGHLISKKYDFEKYFDEIVFSGDYGVKKPHPEIYKLLLEKFPDIKPSNTFFLDDSLKDLESGKNLLMNTIWFKVEDLDDVYIPDFVVENVKQLEKLIKTL